MEVAVGSERANSHLLMICLVEEPNSWFALTLSKGIKRGAPELLLREGNDSEPKKEENPESVWPLITNSHGDDVGIQSLSWVLKGGEREKGDGILNGRRNKWKASKWKDN